MYFPWSGFFELASCADIYVHLDDVQFSKGSFTNRIQIKSPQTDAAGATWLTVPLAGRGSFTDIRDLQPSTLDFARVHRARLQHALAGAPFLSLALSVFDEATASLKQPLVETLEASIERPMAHLELPAPRRWVRSSALGIEGRSSARIVDIVRHLGGTRYVTAHGAANYLDHALFESAGIAVVYIDYSRMPYPQPHGPFTPHVSILDLLANVGPRNAACFCPRTLPWRDFLATSTRNTSEP